MDKLTIIPLGGTREAGKSCFVVECGEDIFVFDCGLLYPDDELLGIDVVIPDFTYLIERRDRVKGIFLTHGHADAVGALPYLLEHVQAPVFGTELTIELAKIYGEEASVDCHFNDYHVIDTDTEIAFDNGIEVSFIKTTHSIPDSVAIALRTDQGSIVYTGDFKFDQSASKLYQTQFGRLTDLGEEGVLALLSDSREAESEIENASEYQIADSIVDLFLNASGRVIVACIASNIQRVQQVFDAAHETNKKIYLTGKKLERIIDTAIRLGKLTIPSKDLIIQRHQMSKVKEDQLVILETGANGEPIHSLQAMAKGQHKDLQLKEGDVVYFATTPNVSMEMLLAQTKDLIYRSEAEVVTLPSNTKASGHATPGQLQLMINLLQPKYLIPVLGEYSKLVAHAQLAHEVGMNYKNTYVPMNGDVIAFNHRRMEVTGQVPVGNVLVDGAGVGDIGNIVLKDRRILSEDGIFVIAMTISRREGKILSGPRSISRGFIFMKTSGNLLDESERLSREIAENYLEKHQEDFDWNDLKQAIREKVSRYLFQETSRRPVVLPVVMDASNYKKAKK
ncbi:ribonuclease J [Atopobacter sp. AH10]|uniref:ribonuclease J n=1 Tax=Atopobacter sp. AH10 TaxID=2315861 RepID=UPI000EF26400|nr:ribonuclease J [Atopobacter sp. AH10]RLK64025.1 ribonuclease J [Atopobacter sp. AH10]